MKINLYIYFLVSFINVKIFTMENDKVVSFDFRIVSKNEKPCSNFLLSDDGIKKLGKPGEKRRFQWKKFEEQGDPIYESIPTGLSFLNNKKNIFEVSIPSRVFFSQLILRIHSDKCIGIKDILEKQKEILIVNSMKVQNEVMKDVNKEIIEASEIIIKTQNNYQLKNQYKLFDNLYYISLVFKNQHLFDYLQNNLLSKISIIEKNNNIILDLSFFIKKILFLSEQLEIGNDNLKKENANKYLVEESEKAVVEKGSNENNLTSLRNRFRDELLFFVHTLNNIIEILKNKKIYCILSKKNKKILDIMYVNFIILKSHYNANLFNDVIPYKEERDIKDNLRYHEKENNTFLKGYSWDNFLELQKQNNKRFFFCLKEWQSQEEIKDIKKAPCIKLDSNYEIHYINLKQDSLDLLKIIENKDIFVEAILDEMSKRTIDINIFGIEKLINFLSEVVSSIKIQFKGLSRDDANSHNFNDGLTEHIFSTGNSWRVGNTKFLEEGKAELSYIAQKILYLMKESYLHDGKKSNKPVSVMMQIG